MTVSFLTQTTPKNERKLFIRSVNHTPKPSQTDHSPMMQGKSKQLPLEQLLEHNTDNGTFGFL